MIGASPKRICVMQTAYLGDVVLSTAMLTALADRYPESEVHVVTTPQAAPLLECHPHVAAVHVFDKRGAHRSPLGMARFAKTLRAVRFDVALCPHPSFRSALLLAMARIRRRIGFDDSAGKWLHTGIVEKHRSQHEVRRVLSLLTALGIGYRDSYRPLLVPDPAIEEATDAKLKEIGLRGKKPVVGVNPFSVWETKRWLPERFASLMDRLAAEDGYRVLLIGGPDDRAEADALLAKCSRKHADAVGKLDLRELMWALKRCDAYVTCDSGPMHMAAALDVPVVAVFGSTVPAQGYAPYSDHAVVVETTLECRPCGPHGYDRCPLGHFLCMRKVQVDDVLAAVRSLASARPVGEAR